MLGSVGKLFGAIVLCGALLSSTASAEESATAAAIADTVTTLAVLANGGSEYNPLIGSNPVAVVAFGIAKLALVNYVKDQEEYTGRLKILTGLWSVGAVNNLLILFGAAGPVALLGGIAGGIAIYNHVKE
jgi:hypothetical protein